MATKTWTGSADSAWSNATNWTGGLPVAGDDLVFTGSVSITSAVDSASVFGNLNFAAFTGAISDTAGANANLTATGNVTLSAGMNAAKLNLTFNGTTPHTFTTANQTIIAVQNNGVAVLTLVGGLTTSTVAGMILAGSTGATFVLGGDINCQAFETDGANIVQGAYKITLATADTGNGLFFEGAASWSWTNGAQLIFAPATGIRLDLFVDAAATPSFPPVVIGGAGTTQLHTANLVCASFTVTTGIWDPQTFSVTIIPVVSPHALTVVEGSGSGSHNVGDVVAIVAATHDLQLKFDHWDTSNGGAFADANAASTNFTMPDNAVTVTPRYVVNSLFTMLMHK